MVTVTSKTIYLQSFALLLAVNVLLYNISAALLRKRHRLCESSFTGILLCLSSVQLHTDSSDQWLSHNYWET